MRKFLTIMLAVGLWSCSVDDSPNEEFFIEILPIETIVDIPQSVTPNEIYNVTFTYVRPTTCHSYNDLYYLVDGSTRTVAVFSRVLNEVNGVICEDLVDSTEERTFTFQVTNGPGNTMIFQFWKGENEEGEDEYLIYEIPIQ